MLRSPLKALIVGGGIGGLSTALTLRYIGAEPHVYERASELRPAGSGLSILSNAVSALRELGLDPHLEKYGEVLTQFEIRNWRGRLIRELPTAAIAEEVGAPSVLIHRADLQQALLDAVGDVPLTLGAAATGYTADEDGVHVRFADGSEAHGDILIGADGLNSAIRRQIAGPEEVQEPGYINWLATIPFSHPRMPTGYVGHFWGHGQRFGLIDIGGGRAYWWATQNRPVERARRWDGGRQELEGAFRRWPEVVRTAIEQTPEERIISVPAQDRHFLENWGSGPVTLLGDAAHPMLTSLGQGAAMAVEDSAVLAHCLNTAPTAERGLRAYEDARRDRTRMTVRASREASRSEQFQSPLACAYRNARFRWTSERRMREQSRPLLTFPGMDG